MSVRLPKDKLFFRIGEVAELIGVKPHVLRYWESEFDCLRPMKTRGTHRQYRRRDVELADLIRELVQEKGYSIRGARRRLRELGHERSAPPAQDDTPREAQLRGSLVSVREELTSLLQHLDAIAAAEVRERAEPDEVVVEAAILIPSRPHPRS